MWEDKDSPVKSVVEEATSKHASGIPQYSLYSLRYWDVVMSPTMRYMLAGQMVPSLKSAAVNLFMKKRRITIEVYRPSSNIESEKKISNRGQTKRLFGELLKGISSSALMDIDDIGDHDLITFRILKPEKRRHAAGDKHSDDGSQDDDDTQSVSGASFSTFGFGSDDGVDLESSRVHWNERFRCRLDTLQILSQQSGRSCELQMGGGSAAVVKVLNFDSNFELQAFCKVLTQMRTFQERRRKRLADSYKEAKASARSPAKKRSPLNVASRDRKVSPTGGVSKAIVATNGDKASKEAPVQPRALFSEEIKTESEVEMIQILVEIVSATNLPIADILSSDPYVKIMDGNKELHRTKVLSKTLNPVWTIATGSLCIIQMAVDDYFSKTNFITMQVKDYDTFGKNEDIGTVTLSKDMLLKGTGERLEFAIVPPAKNKFTKRTRAGKSLLALRFRQATSDDVEFMKTFQENSKKRRTAVYADDTFLPPRDHKVFMMQKQERKGRNHFVEYRVKPFPDPERRLETTWLTKKEIHFEASRPSRYWVESGTGGLGKVFVEVLGCDHLPNLDISLTGRDKTDAFACLVFEDCIVNTDVINDTLSPRWMPWSQRAFILNIMHPSSQLMVGVFDHDSGIADPGHDPVGRAVVNLTNLRQGTEYTLTYVLYESYREERVARGSITLRIRVEIPNNRKLLLGGAVPVLHHDVSVATRQYFRTTHHTISHGESPSVLSLRCISSRVQELQSYLEVLFYLQGGVATVLLWRGHYPIHFRVPCPRRTSREQVGCLDRWTRVVTIKLPIHSMISFGWGIVLARDFEKFPSFLVFAVAWFLLATMEHARNRPLAYVRPKSYWELLGVLLFNLSPGPITVKRNENLDAINEYNESRAALKKAREEVVKTIQMEQKKYEAYLNMEVSKLEEEVDIMTQARGGLSSLTLAPFKGVLLPLQRALHGICIMLRITKSIVVWRESLISFWIVTLCLLGSLLLLWIPWTFLISWSFKVVVWVFLGPWMKLVDIFYFRRTVSEEEQKKAGLAQKFKERYTTLLDESFGRKLRKESALKMKEVKKYMFGEYLLRVPVFKEERFYDDPLPSSHAERFDSSTVGNINVIDRKYGQLLKGDMIPSRELRITKESGDGPKAATRKKNINKESKDEGKSKKKGRQRSSDVAVPSGENESKPLLKAQEEGAYGSLV